MTKSELIERIAQKQTQLAYRDVELAVKTVLEHMAERLANGDRIAASEFRFEPQTEALDETIGQPGPEGLQEGLKSSETRMILDALSKGGSRKRAAELLGISPRTLRYKIAKLRESGAQVPGRGGITTA